MGGRMGGGVTDSWGGSCGAEVCGKEDGGWAGRDWKGEGETAGVGVGRWGGRESGLIY